MLREIYEQPSKISATLSQYIDAEGLCAETCGDVERWIASVHGKLRIVASGSSRHAGMIAELIIEEMSGVPIDVEYASEYSYRCENSLADAAVLVVCKSGETADTLAALRKANFAGHATLAITNACGRLPQQRAEAWPQRAGIGRHAPGRYRRPQGPDSAQRYDKVVQLMRDMREQGASVLAIADEGDVEVRGLATHTVYVKEMREILMGICEVIPLQLLSYWMAINNGIDVDHPRNLTKAVLAENPSQPGN